MGNLNNQPDLYQTSSENENELPSLTIDRNICENIKIGVNASGSFIKYKNNDIYYFYKLIKSNKEKNYIEFNFENDSSLIVFSKEETCSEKEKTQFDLQFMFKSPTLNINGVIVPKYTNIDFANTPFDEISKLQ